MKFDTPATTNPIDQMKVVGKPLDRIDGPLKTTGTAPYAHDRHDVVPNQAHGYILGAAIAKGRIVSMDLAAATAAPGVITIVTARNAGKLVKGDFNTALLRLGQCSGEAMFGPTSSQLNAFTVRCAGHPDQLECMPEVPDGRTR